MLTIFIIACILIVTFIIRTIFISDTDGSINKSVSWEYVRKNTNNLVWAKCLINKQCPKCDLESGKLQWFRFRSSNASWRDLGGREGFYSMCPDCKIIVVENIITAMN
jgi:hypothetical protein